MNHLSLYNIFLCILCCSSPLLIIVARTLWTVLSGYFCLAKSCMMVWWDTWLPMANRFFSCFSILY